MIAALFLLAQAVAQVPAPAPAGAPPLDPAALPTLRFVTPAPADAPVAQFVRDEVAAGRCTAAVRDAQGSRLRVDVAVLVDEEGRARRVVPVAIGCPTVEQYAAGIVSRMARRTIDVRDASGHGWFRTSLNFAWTG